MNQYARTAVTGAGTRSFEFEATNAVYTELQCGSYIFMDDRLRAEPRPRQRHLYDVRAGHLRALRHGRPDEDLEETLALIRAKLVELEKAFKHGGQPPSARTSCCHSPSSPLARWYLAA